MKNIFLGVALLAAVAAAGFAWQQHQAQEAARGELATSNADLQKTQAELRTVSAEIAPLRKESAEHKQAFEQQQADLAAAKAFLETERQTSARLRDDLLKAKEQLALANRPRASQAAPSRTTLEPMMIRPQTPPPVRAVSSGSAVGNAVRAQ